MNPQQLTLPVRLPDDITFASFCPGVNQALVDYLKEFVLKPNCFCVYLWGQAGVGRSHLLQACCQQAHEQGLRAIYLPLAQLCELTPQFFADLESCALVCLDDLATIAGKQEWEEALFHFYNRLQAAQSSLLIAAHTLPSHTGIQLPDLLSRLASSMIFQVQKLSDQDKLLALQLRARARGLELSDEVGYFLLARFPRDLPALFTMLETLDKASLTAQRKLTIPFVKNVLMFL